MAPKTVSALETHLGYWLRFVSNHVSQSFQAKMAARGVTVAEWVMLRALFDTEGVGQSQLVERIGLTPGAVSKLVDRLLAKGLVGRVADEDDQRCLIVALTPRGRKLVPVLARLADQNDHEFFGHLNERQCKFMAGILKDIVRRHGMKDSPTR